MRRSRLIFVCALLLQGFNSCGPENVMTGNDGSELRFSPVFHAGASSGGLVENMELTGVEGISELDAITGASQMAFTLGLHSEIEWKDHAVETGLDYLAFNQAVDYNLPSFATIGKRDFRFHQLRVPLSYNFRFLKDSEGFAKLTLRAGLSVGVSISKDISESGNPPAYTFTNFDYGPMLGVSFLPIQIREKYRLGISLEAYRGSRIYDDAFHKAEGMGGQSFMKFGLAIRPF